MRTFRSKAILMSALGIAMSAGGAAGAAAYDTVEKFIVTGALKVTHVLTEQVCEFDTLDQLENYLANVVNAHHWFRHDQPAAASLTSSYAENVGKTAETRMDTDVSGDVGLAAPAIQGIKTAADPLGQRDALARPSMPPAVAVDQIDTTAAQVGTLAQGPEQAPAIELAPVADAAAATSDAPAASTEGNTVA